VHHQEKEITMSETSAPALTHLTGCRGRRVEESIHTDPPASVWRCLDCGQSDRPQPDGAIGAMSGTRVDGAL
jgi:hypothetical protein